MYIVKYWPLAAVGVVAILVGGVGFVASNPDVAPSLPVWEVEIEPGRDNLTTTHSMTLCSGPVEISSEGPPAPVGQPTPACASCRNQSNACDCGANCQCSDCSCDKSTARIASIKTQSCGPGGCTAPGFFPKTPSFTVEFDSPPPGCGPEGCQAPPMPSLGPHETLPPPQCVDFKVMRELIEARAAAAVAEAKLEMHQEHSRQMQEVTSALTEAIASREVLKAEVAQMKERVGEFKQLAELFAANKVLETKLAAAEEMHESRTEATEGAMEIYAELFEKKIEHISMVAELTAEIAMLEQQLAHSQQGAENSGREKQHVAQFEHLIKENNILRTHIGVLEEELFQLDPVKTAECPEPKPAVKR